jgi:predicted dehydrogenase
VFGSKAWAEVGDVEHLTTWDLKVCTLDPQNITVKQQPVVHRFEKTSTERAELEHFAQQAGAGKPLVLPGGDAVHNVALLGAIVNSIQTGLPVRLA